MLFSVITSYTGYRVWHVEADSELEARQYFHRGSAILSEDDDEWVTEVEEV